MYSPVRRDFEVRRRPRESLLSEVKDRLFAIDYSLPSSWFDVKRFFWDVADVLVSPVLLRAKQRQFQEYQGTFRFWSTWQAHAVYMSVGLTILTGRALCLWFAGLVMELQILWILTKWLVYIRDDEAVDNFIDFCTLWIARFLREGEKIMKGKDAISYVMAYSVVKSAPTGFTYARYIIRYNMRRANAQLLLDATERFAQYESRLATAKAKLEDRVKSSGQRIIKSTAATFQHSKSSFDFSMPIEVDLEGIIDDGTIIKRTKSAGKNQMTLHHAKS